jgi:hypothetical protein
MPLTGKYDFKGIKEKGAQAIEALLVATSWGAWLVKGVFSPVTTFVIQGLVNYVANKGLVLLNIGAFYIEGEFDQSAFDKAIEDGIKQAHLANGTLTPEKIKAIDDAVIEAARKFIPYTHKH